MKIYAVGDECVKDTTRDKINIDMHSLVIASYNQVETIGDKYMAVSGLPEPCKEQAPCITQLALDMMDLSIDVHVMIYQW